MAGRWRTKSVEQSIADTDEPDTRLRKELTWRDLAVFGVAVVIGAGIFTVTASTTGDELAVVDTAVAEGLQPASTRPGWRHLKHPDGYVTSFWVLPRDITSETLDWLWLHDTDATVVTIRLTAAAGRAKVSARVRYHSEKRLGKKVCGPG